MSERAIDRPYLAYQGDEAPSATRLRIPERELPPIPARDADYTEALRCVAQAYTVSVAELVGRDKHKAIAEARMVAYWLLRTLTRMSYPEIGRALHKDHTSVMSGVRRVLLKREVQPEFEAFTDRLAEAAAARMGT